MSFLEKWLEAVDKKNSVLCAGLDPAEFEMGRGEKGLPKNIQKLQWALRYIEAVAPFCAAIKPNIQYWKSDSGLDSTDMEHLQDIYYEAEGRGLIVIDDSKLADIGATNDAGFWFANGRADAVTYSPFAGNIEEAAGQAHEYDLGIIGMCLMSNPEYGREKNKLVNIDDDIKGYNLEMHAKFVNGSAHVPQYIYLAREAYVCRLDGLVIGAPSEKNHIEEFEIKNVRHYAGDNMLVLLPGLGAQGGEAGAIWKHFGKDRVIVNVGRSLMLPNGSNSTPDEQAETAKHYQKMLNELRA